MVTLFLEFRVLKRSWNHGLIMLAIYNTTYHQVCYFFNFPLYLQSVPVHSANVVKSCPKACRRVLTSTLLYLIRSESSCDLGNVSSKIRWLTMMNCKALLNNLSWSNLHHTDAYFCNHLYIRTDGVSTDIEPRYYWIRFQNATGMQTYSVKQFLPLNPLYLPHPLCPTMLYLSLSLSHTFVWDKKNSFVPMDLFNVIFCPYILHFALSQNLFLYLQTRGNAGEKILRRLSCK
jgi:hypothetical protein